MKYSKEEVMQYVSEEDVKFIRLAFCDVFGRQKNVSVMPYELPRAFEYGEEIDASAIGGFGKYARGDLLLHPDPETLTWLPWRPEHGKVVRMFCSVTYPDGRPFACDTRTVLKEADAAARAAGYSFLFGTKQEFYLFELDERNLPTARTYDAAGYMDIAPEDRGENVRRDICLTLEQMGITPKSSHHEEGPGQNSIDLRFMSALEAADAAMTFRTVASTVARRNGLYADLSAKPVEGAPGNGFTVGVTPRPDCDAKTVSDAAAGMLAKLPRASVFFDPSEASYARLSELDISLTLSDGGRGGFVRLPAPLGGFRRAELTSADPSANPYIAFSLIIRAALCGLSGLSLSEGAAKLPSSLAEAKASALADAFVSESLPREITEIFCG